jgi:hypothetical protein
MISAAKRVAVARETLRLARQRRKLTIKRGVFISTRTYVNDAMVISTKDAKDVQDVVKNEAQPLECCAVGGAVLGLASLFDGMPLGNVFDRNAYRTIFRISAPHRKVIAQAVRVFGKRTVQAMEIAFECGDGAYRKGGLNASALTSSEQARAQAFGMKYRSNKTRYIAIFNHIAKNGGLFFRR